MANGTYPTSPAVKSNVRAIFPVSEGVTTRARRASLDRRSDNLYSFKYLLGSNPFASACPVLHDIATFCRSSNRGGERPEGGKTGFLRRPPLDQLWCALGALTT